jgi:hypothetical protein
VVHQGGGCRSGHYFSYCKGFDGEWYDCNDDFVGRSRIDIVLRQQAYILFYQKRLTLAKPVAPKTEELSSKTKPKPEVVTQDAKSLEVPLSNQSTSISSNNLSSDRSSSHDRTDKKPKKEEIPEIKLDVTKIIIE